MSATSPVRATAPKDATEMTRGVIAAAQHLLPFTDRQDFADAERGRIAAPNAGVIAGTGGLAVWDMDAYAFEAAEETPATVHPSLWRQAKLNRVAGLFKVVERVYQVRGLDISNLSIIEGDSGLIVIDPLISTECAAAAMDLYYQHRGRKPVVAAIYTHSHVDHYAGVKGVISEYDVAAGKIQILAPTGFMEHAVSENVFAGTAMSRRSLYQYGVFLPKNARGQVDLGLGKAVSTGTITLIAATDSIAEPRATRTIDGVEIEFQLTPGTDAPAEMNFYFPQFRALPAGAARPETLSAGKQEAL